jgi:hypothetical protein
VVDFNNQRIREITADGTMLTVVGDGRHTFASTGEPATSSPLENPIDAAFDGDGRLVFVSLHDPRVLYVDDDGILRSLAGTGNFGDSGDGGPAQSATFTELSGLAIADDGTIYVADGLANRVRAITPDGTIALVAGSGARGHAGDGGPATEAALSYPTALALDADGRVLFADSGNHAVRRVDADGTIETIAGTGSPGFSGDGGPAIEAALHTPEGIAVAPDGRIFVSDWENNRVRVIDPSGTIDTFAGNGSPDFDGDGGPALTAGLAGPARLTLSQEMLYIADQLNDCVRGVRLE